MLADAPRRVRALNAQSADLFERALDEPSPRDLAAIGEQLKAVGRELEAIRVFAASLTDRRTHATQDVNG